MLFAFLEVSCVIPLSECIDSTVILVVTKPWLVACQSFVCRHDEFQLEVGLSLLRVTDVNHSQMPFHRIADHGLTLCLTPLSHGHRDPANGYPFQNQASVTFVLDAHGGKSFSRLFGEFRVPELALSLLGAAFNWTADHELSKIPSSPPMQGLRVHSYFASLCLPLFSCFSSATISIGLVPPSLSPLSLTCKNIAASRTNRAECIYGIIQVLRASAPSPHRVC